MTDDPGRTDMDAALQDAAEAIAPQQGVKDQASALARGAQLLRLRANRMTYDQIAAQAGYSDRGAARRALIDALARHEAENAAELRVMENLALDADERALRAIIIDPDATPGMKIRAIDARTRLSARRSRLNGLDAPVAVQISAGVQAGLDNALGELEEAVADVISLRPLSVVDEPLDEEERSAWEA